MFNEEIEAARDTGRKPLLPGDVRSRARHTGIATQHRIYAALRAFLNHAWKKTHKITFNPVYAVELESEVRQAPIVWEPERVAQFLAHTADDRLHFLWRLALLRGFRRGELAGLAHDDIDLDTGTITVNVALLQIGRKLVWGRPKSRAGERIVDLDAGTIAIGKAHRARRKRERLAAGETWQESGQAFTTEDGRCHRLHLPPVQGPGRSRRPAGDQAPRGAAHGRLADAGSRPRREDRASGPRPLHVGDHARHLPTRPAEGTQGCGRKDRRAPARPSRHLA